MMYRVSQKKLSRNYLLYYGGFAIIQPSLKVAFPTYGYKPLVSVCLLQFDDTTMTSYYFLDNSYKKFFIVICSFGIYFLAHPVYITY